VGFFATSGILNERGFFGEGFDPDALDYINRVETADTERLEPRVRTAINQFVLGCKADGIWSAIKASCIMAGARTLSGAIIPLAGNAPTNFNFVSGDYDRKTGLLGNGSTKYLNTGYLSNTFFTNNNDHHLSVYVSSAATTSATLKIFIGNSVGVGGRSYLSKSTTDQFSARMATSSSLENITGQGITTGFKGASRSASTTTNVRTGGSNTASTLTSSAFGGGLILQVFNGAGVGFCDARMSFYSMGTSANLDLLDARITTLMNTLSSVIA
jgi:hypothetical protein